MDCLENTRVSYAPKQPRPLAHAWGFTRSFVLNPKHLFIKPFKENNKTEKSKKIKKRKINPLNGGNDHPLGRV